FLELSYGSTMDLASTFYLTLDERYIVEADVEPLFDDLEVNARRIAALNRSLDIKASKIPFNRE
ncbi:MAG TPA: hypothetical protein VN625_03375, partial [Desulfuromonadaceae bacterium]|nr:hypothetical protein [Desulfuromonadaceae bacterium]